MAWWKRRDTIQERVDLSGAQSDVVTDQILVLARQVHAQAQLVWRILEDEYQTQGGDTADDRDGTGPSQID